MQRAQAAGIRAMHDARRPTITPRYKWGRSIYGSRDIKVVGCFIACVATVAGAVIPFPRQGWLWQAAASSAVVRQGKRQSVRQAGVSEDQHTLTQRAQHV